MVLDGASVDLHSGEIVGVIGANGAGKTTLFRVIIGRVTPDSGVVTRSKGMQVGYLAQEPELDLSRTLHDEVLNAFEGLLAIERRIHRLSEEMAGASGEQLDALMTQYDRANAEFVAAGGYRHEQRLHEVLAGLGFSRTDYQLPIAALSGGQRCRAALAKLLLEDSAYLLLDEPTNHLDIDAVRWLEQFLKARQGGAAIISHDRYLLDRVVYRIIEFERGRIASFPGGYSDYQRGKELNAVTQERRFEKDQAFIAKERDFIARHLAGQRSKEAQGRRTRLARMLADGEFVTERVAQRRALQLAFEIEPLDEGRTIFRAEGVSKRYGAKVLFDDLSLEVSGGARIGITGPNGAGKSTLLRVLLGRIAPDAGEVKVDPKAQIGYYSQDAGELDSEASILGEIRACRPDLSETQARSILGQFLFSGDDVFRPLGRCSGGEQSRVRLLKLMLSMPTVLVLDEPTNHLDIVSCEALEEALQDYPGVLLVVSHDRYFLDRVIDQLLVVRDGGARRIRGNYTTYVEILEREEAARAAKEELERSAAAKKSGATPTKKPGQKAAKSKYEKMPLAELEAFIAEREGQLAEIQERFGAPDVYKDPSALALLDAQYEAAKAELAEAEVAWLKLADAAG